MKSDQMQELIQKYKSSKKGFHEGKELVNYLSKNKINQHSELILDFGIHLSEN